MKKHFFTLTGMTAAAGLLFCACTPFEKTPEQKTPAAPETKEEVKVDPDTVKTAYDKPETKTAFHALSAVKAMKELQTISYKTTHAKTKTVTTFSGKRNGLTAPSKTLQDSAERFHALSHFDWEAVAYQISAVPKKERTYLLKIRPQFKWYAGLDVQLTFDAQGRLVKEEVIDQKGKSVIFSRTNTKFDQTGFPAEFKNTWRGVSESDIWQISEVKRNEPEQTKQK